MKKYCGYEFSYITVYVVNQLIKPDDKKILLKCEGLTQTL